MSHAIKNVVYMTTFNPADSDIILKIDSILVTLPYQYILPAFIDR